MDKQAFRKDGGGSMKTALLSIAENVFIGDNPHAATFTLLTLEDGSTAPLGRIKRIAVPNKGAALEWAAANSIRIVQEAAEAIDDQ